MTCSHPRSFQRSPSFFTSCVLAVVMLSGIGRADEGSSSRISSSPAERIDLNAVFAADETPLIARFSEQTIRNRRQNRTGTVRSNDLNTSAVRLVSQEMPPEPGVTATTNETPATPLYVMQQPTFQQVDGNAYAGPSSTTRGTWALIAPYAWAAGVNGQIGVGNQLVNVDITPGQVMANLGKVDGALMLHSEVGRGDWGFILDANLIRAGTSVTTAQANVGVTLQQTLIEALATYRLIEVADYWVEGRSASVDLLAGARIYEFSNIFTVRPFDPTLPPNVPLGLSTSWVDMVIGGRARAPITKTLDVFGRADIGGFGVGSSSILAWNLIGGVDWKLSQCASLSAGYRELNVNKTGSGTGGQPFVFDAKLYGPFMAFVFQF